MLIVPHYCVLLFICTGLTLGAKMPSSMGLHRGFVLLLRATGVMLSSFFSFFLITWIVIIIAAVVAKEL